MKEKNTATRNASPVTHGEVVMKPPRSRIHSAPAASHVAAHGGFSVVASEPSGGRIGEERLRLWAVGLDRLITSNAMPEYLNDNTSY